MRKLHFNFSEIDSDKSFVSLARALQSNVHNNLITLSPSVGEGSIRKLKLEDGLYMRAWDMCTTRETVFNKIPDLAVKEKQFHVTYFFNPELLLDENPKLGKKMEGCRKGQHAFLFKRCGNAFST